MKLGICFLAVAITLTHAQASEPTDSDFDGSGRVDFADFLSFAGAFGKRAGDEGFDSRFDLDASTSVDFGDFLIFASNFGKSTTEQNGTFLYVSDIVENRVEAVDIATNLTIPSRSFSVSFPRGLTIGPQTGSVYVATLDSIFVYNDQGQLSYGVGLTPFDNPAIGETAASGFKVRVNSAETLAFVSESASGAVEIIDLVNRTSLAVVPVGFNPGGMALSQDESELYVGIQETHIPIINVASRTLVDSISIGSSALNKLGISTDGSTLFAITSTSDDAHMSGTLIQVLAIDRLSRTVTDSVQISNTEDLLDQVSEIQVNPNGGSLLVSLFRTAPAAAGSLDFSTLVGDLVVISLPGLSVSQNITIGEFAAGFGISPDGSTAYVSGSEDLASGVFRVFVVDLLAGERLSQLPISIQSATEFVFESTKQAIAKAIALIDLAIGG